MKPDFFKHLPPEITTNIILRLSLRRIAVSKCVCKPWLQLLETDDFISSHFAQSAPTLALTMRTVDSTRLKLYEFEKEEKDELDPLTSFAFPSPSELIIIGGSANGFLYLYDIGRHGCYSYVCNPITREFIEIHLRGVRMCGFGVSRISRQYKVVNIAVRNVGDRRFECHVYTLGTGSWRLVEDVSFGWSSCKVGAFAHGSLHWMVSNDDWDGKERIACFDLETERFSSFAVPPLVESNWGRPLYVLRNSLGFCDKSSEGGGDGVVVWVMKEYGVENSWTKECVIGLGVGPIFYRRTHPVKVFDNGDVLVWFDKTLCYYSKKSGTSREVGAGEFDFDCAYVTSMLHTPTMLSLKCFSPMENVTTLCRW